MPTLDWLSRQEAFTSSARVPYRLLDQVSLHGDAASNAASQGNLLIQGDNLEALKALLPFYRGQVKCIFIDPPYNTKSAFEHYDDNLEHSQWLSMMLPRLQLLRELLTDDGSIWVTIDDNEGHYLKVLMDEVFGRGNFVANGLWQKRTSPDARIHMGAAHDHILVYAKAADKTTFNALQLSVDQASNFKNPDKDPRGSWASTDFTAQGWRPNQMYAITTPGGTKYTPPPGRCWGNIEPAFQRLLSEGRMWFGKDGNSRPRVKNYLTDSEGISSWSWWGNEDVGHNQESKKEINEIFGADNTFDTPKPERLLQRILHIASNENDLILDSFLGSGTTAAVAHKMRRRWIGIEMGEHAATHCLPRLQKVIGGEQGGISKAHNWKGGGGFRFLRLGEPVFDESGRISAAVRFNTLAAFIWQQETGQAWDAAGALAGTPHLGIHYTTEPLALAENQSEDHYENNSTLHSIDAGKVPKTLIKTAQKAVYLLYNGILKDKRPESGNVLTAAVLDALLTLHAQVCASAGLGAQDIPLTVYGEACRQGEGRLERAGVTFKHIPYDVRAR